MTVQSGFSHGYQYDLFISYSTSSVKWVRPFYDALKEELKLWVKYPVVTFWDKEGLKPGDTWDAKLLDASTNSAVLIPILTPMFFESDYCAKELESFLGGTGISGDDAHRSRVFPVELLSSAPKEHWLAGCQAMSFCGRNSLGIPLEFEPDSAEFKEALRHLALAIAEKLPHVPPKASGRPAVYLADNFLEASKVLRKALNHKYDVLPAMPEKLMEMDAAELQKHIQDSLAKSFVSVHLLERRPAADFLVKTQLELARAIDKPHLVWTAAQSDELNDLTNAGFEWFDSQAGIEERIRVLNSQPAKFKNPGSNPLIYFLCQDRANRDEAEPLLNILRQQGVCIYPSPITGPADEAMTRHVKALEELDGCLIYYGNTEQDWFDTVFLRLRRHIQERRLRSAIYVGPPPSYFKDNDLKFLGVPLLKQPPDAAKYFAGESA